MQSSSSMRRPKVYIKDTFR